MNNNIEPERDPAVETEYSVEEAEQMGAFVEDALSFKDARESIEDFRPIARRKLMAIRFAGAKKARRSNTGALMRSVKSRIPMVALFLMPMESRARKRSAWNGRKCLSHMCSTPSRLMEFRRRRLVSVPGTRLKRLNSLFKQQIPNFSTLPVIVRFTGRQRIPSICL